jgi:hypothetical protein
MADAVPVVILPSKRTIRFEATVACGVSFAISFAGTQLPSATRGQTLLGKDFHLANATTFTGALG